MTTSIHVTITVDPSKASAFLEAFKPVRALLAVTPENLATYMYRNPKVPGEFKLVENWNADQAWVMALLKQNEVVQGFFATTEDMLVKPKALEVWSLVEEK